MQNSQRPKPPRLIFLLTLAERSVKGWLDSRGRKAGASAATAGVLMFLRNNTSASTGEIGAALGASPAGISGLLSRMESNNLITRKPQADDQRIIRVQLTDHGHQLAAVARGRVDQLNAILTDGFDEEELAIVARWLQHVAQNLRNDTR